MRFAYPCCYSSCSSRHKWALGVDNESNAVADALVLVIFAYAAGTCIYACYRQTKTIHVVVNLLFAGRSIGEIKRTGKTAVVYHGETPVNGMSRSRNPPVFPRSRLKNTYRHYANAMNILPGKTLLFLTALRQIRDHGENLLSLNKRTAFQRSPGQRARLHPLTAVRKDLRPASIKAAHFSSDTRQEKPPGRYRINMQSP